MGLPTVTIPEVIHRDGDILVVHKPPNLPTTSPSSVEACLVRWVEEQFPDLRAHPTSRLDSRVSGIVTFALNEAANRRLLQARRAGTYTRLYLGITLHSVESTDGVWSWPISLDPQNPKRRKATKGVGKRDARTRYEVASQAPHGLLLRMMPETGRTHQLRVHAARAGAPLFGDVLYQGERRCVLADGTVITARRVMLHCAKVEFPGATGRRLRFEATIPRDLERIWLTLGGKHGDFGSY